MALESLVLFVLQGHLIQIQEALVWIVNPVLQERTRPVALQYVRCVPWDILEMRLRLDQYRSATNAALELTVQLLVLHRVFHAQRTHFLPATGRLFVSLVLLGLYQVAISQHALHVCQVRLLNLGHLRARTAFLGHIRGQEPIFAICVQGEHTVLYRGLITLHLACFVARGPTHCWQELNPALHAVKERPAMQQAR